MHFFEDSAKIRIPLSTFTSSLNTCTLMYTTVVNLGRSIKIKVSEIERVIYNVQKTKNIEVILN